jgi:hypothetical protein
MNLITRSVASTLNRTSHFDFSRTGHCRYKLIHIRSYASSEKFQNTPPRIPDNITIELSLDKIFKDLDWSNSTVLGWSKTVKDAKLDEKYIFKKIAESLKEYLPQTITVQNIPNRTDPGSKKPYQQPPIINRDEFLAYVSFYHDLSKTSHHFPYQVEYIYRDDSTPELTAYRSSSRYIHSFINEQADASLKKKADEEKKD